MRRKSSVLAGIPFACAIIVTLTGCARDTSEAQRATLPGFSVELPRGRVITTSTRPTAGKHAVQLPSPPWSNFFNSGERSYRELEVNWSTNAMPRAAWSSQLIPALAPKIAAAGPNPKILEERSVADDRWFYVVGTESTPVGIGVVNCDPRFAIVVTYVRYTDRARLAESLSRIVNSVQCAVTAANRDRPVAATRLPAKFGWVTNPEAQTFQSLDGEFLAITVGDDNVQRKPELFREVMAATASAVLGTQLDDWQYVQNPTPERNASILRAAVPASGRKVYVGAVHCTPANISLIVFWFGSNPSDNLARERFSQIGCPGDASTPSPDFAKLAQAACAAGDQAACNLLATLP